MECVIRCETALLPEGWAHDVDVSISARGDIGEVQSAGEPGSYRIYRGTVLPGMPNLHSHAFQRAMAGLAETAQTERDSFWTWRQLMYRFLERIGPAELETIAEFLYIEMLKAGYTSVAEFHYLHHAADGSPYTDRAEMSLAIVRAARRAGIALTLLPVYYARGGFGGQTPVAGQRRFLHGEDRYLDLLQRLQRESNHGESFRLGAAFHSLRAVSPDELGRLIGQIGLLQDFGPIHIHIAEQEREVSECMTWSGQRPVAWLLDHVDVNPHWCLVHATHMDDAEAHRLADTGAVVGLCPTTEANLGDGLFPAEIYQASEGRFGIGSDSHVAVSPAAELRLLEYGQRLLHKERNRMGGGASRSTGTSLWRAALAGGAQAVDRPTAAIRAGLKADLVVLDPQEPMFAARQGDQIVDTWMFGLERNPVRQVVVDGRLVVNDGCHPRDHEVAQAFRQVMRRLLRE